MSELLLLLLPVIRMDKHTVAGGGRVERERESGRDLCLAKDYYAVFRDSLPPYECLNIIPNYTRPVLRAWVYYSWDIN